MVERPDSIVYSNARENLANNKYWKNYLLKEYLPKRSELAKQQLTQPFILKMDDFDLRAGLTGLVEKFLDEIENG